MVAGIDELDAIRELLEVETLRRSKRMSPEIRNDHSQEILALSNHVAVQMFPVIVQPPVDDHLSDSEELTKLVETVDARGALRHYELVSDLVPGSVATSVWSAGLANEAD